jgi:single-stranded DNA-binding protein
MEAGRDAYPPLLNLFFLSGRVQSRQHIKVTQKGLYVLEFELAMPRRDDAGKETVDIFDVEIWGDQARDSDRALVAGTCVFVEGTLSSRQFEVTGKAVRRRMVLKASRLEILGG